MQYYLPGLDVSSLDDDQFAEKLGFLLRIRKMEQSQAVLETLNKMLHAQQ